MPSIKVCHRQTFLCGISTRQKICLPPVICPTCTCRSLGHLLPSYPTEHWNRIRTNNTIERVNREIKRRTRAIGAFHDGQSALMLVCARLRHVAVSDWGSKRYLNMDHLYVTGNHEAIIEPEIFDMVQRELARRCKGRNRHSGVHDFSGKIKCGECGSWFGSKVWHSNDKYRRVIWQCNHKYDGKKCSTPHVDDKTIETAFLRSVNRLIAEKSTVMANYETIKEMLFSTDSLESEEKELRHEMEVVSNMIRDAINENARTAIDQTDFQSRYDSLVKRFDDTKAKHDAVCAEMDDKRIRRATVEQFLADIAKRNTLLTEFETETWRSLVNYVTVYNLEDIRITFKNGKEI